MTKIGFRKLTQLKPNEMSRSFLSVCGFVCEKCSEIGKNVKNMKNREMYFVEILVSYRN